MNVYLDHAATTPVHPQVIEAMLPYWTADYGNPSSAHAFGRKANQGLDGARRKIAALLGAQPLEIVFTGCGSEANNLAIRGAMLAARQKGQGNHLITSAIEHTAVLNTAKQLCDVHGFELTVLPVDEFGRVQIEDVQNAIREDTVLVSIMAANNEIGTLQPIEEIGRLTRSHNILFHTDAVQRIPVEQWDMSAMPIDMMSIAPHKFYGPKGVGILYVRKDLDLVPHLTGGGQEEGRRAGTSNVAFAVGAATALELTYDGLEDRLAHYRRHRDRLIDGILSACGDSVVLTGHPTERLPHNASFAVKHGDGNMLLMHLDLAGIAGSSGSACKTGNPKPSSVLEATGLSDAYTKGGLRLTVGKQTTDEEIEHTLAVVPQVIEKQKKLNSMLTG